MSDSSTIEVAVVGFRDFIDTLDEHTLRECASVEQLIRWWLMPGNPAAEDCRCDHRIFLSAVACIFAEWHDLRCVNGEEHVIPGHITHARNTPHSPERICTNIFDPYVFIAAVEDYRYRIAGSRRTA
jgi:hypothetical protein